MTPRRRGSQVGSTDGDRGYHPCALAASWPLSALPSDEDFLKIEGES